MNKLPTIVFTVFRSSMDKELIAAEKLYKMELGMCVVLPESILVITLMGKSPWSGASF